MFNEEELFDCWAIPLMNKIVEQQLREIEEEENKPIDIPDWFKRKG